MFTVPVRFLVAGEALVDVVTDANGTAVTRPGGSPANVAVGLGRLGLPVELVTALGDDDNGRLVSSHLAESCVKVRASELASTSVALATLDSTGASSYEFDFAWALDSTVLPETADWLHVGSLGVIQQPGATVVADLVRRLTDTAVVSYDPNLRPSLMGSPSDVLDEVEHQVRHSKVVKLSDEDAAWLCPEETAQELASRWLALGPTIVVVTRGRRGAIGWTRGFTVAVPAAPCTVLDTVGAGDSFMAGLIFALSEVDIGALSQGQLRAALTLAAEAAALTCGRAGADPPWLRELRR